uniref:Tyrosine--tRNA ligase n=1 Tax=Methanocaldococcus jannaschii (strain ATCC 43067 / DSM 2661 / JAL-1 / JCM 10045 / NBRC 100440) TaxID=243232 RepID=UPI000FE182EB|nr:Chain A, Tyrosine--tRNA ligase [Methanocaldococcus jannaschii DSM 2661]5NSF_B Chain B, Tyrosine--tRNA ligase [Methanocaldococcus jannaschii DSM 2661]5NSF_C Chain C, Tyrosine--tRNA ligase [Methanocaldococcus jannaschii DSM 2661]5NSF_D Chain D, Tyrosine--tRNA ligase [Methanocaldococcus jannaschii DSM 2661]
MRGSHHHHHHGSMDEFEMIKRNTSEIISEEELREVLKKDEKSAGIGFEPSGKIHLGHYLQIKKMIDLQNAGFDIIIWLADLGAYLNQKGELDEIRKIGDYNKKVFEAMGLKAKYVYGSEHNLDKDYTLNVYRLALKTTLKRARRSMELIAREDENPKVAEVIYPIMQVNAIHYNGVDVAVGGMEQRKIHMLARELLPKKVVCIHNPVLTGLDGEGKMSSSKGNFIAVDDSPEEIRAKIKKAYCPAGVVEGNPIMEIAKYFLEYPLTIKRPEKFGGDLTVNSYEELESLFKNKELHPMRLKNAVAEELIKILEPIRKRL